MSRPGPRVAERLFLEGASQVDGELPLHDAPERPGARLHLLRVPSVAAAQKRRDGGVHALDPAAAEASQGPGGLVAHGAGPDLERHEQGLHHLGAAVMAQRLEQVWGDGPLCLASARVHATPGRESLVGARGLQGERGGPRVAEQRILVPEGGHGPGHARLVVHAGRGEQRPGAHLAVLAVPVGIEALRGLPAVLDGQHLIDRSPGACQGQQPRQHRTSRGESSAPGSGRRLPVCPAPWRRSRTVRPRRCARRGRARGRARAPGGRPAGRG